jgi:hypothetical protein
MEALKDVPKDVRKFFTPPEVGVPKGMERAAEVGPYGIFEAARGARVPSGRPLEMIQKMGRAGDFGYGPKPPEQGRFERYTGFKTEGRMPTAMTEADVDPSRITRKPVYPPDRVLTDFTAERAGTPATGVPSLPAFGKFDWTGVKRDIALLTEDARRRFDEAVGGRELPFATPEGREAASPEELMGYVPPGETREGGPPSIWADEGFYAADAVAPEEMMGLPERYGAGYRPGMTGEQIRAAEEYKEETLPGLGKTPGGFVPGGQLTAEEVKREPKFAQLDEGPPKRVTPEPGAPGAAPAAAGRQARPGNMTAQGIPLGPGERVVGKTQDAREGFMVYSGGEYVSGDPGTETQWNAVRDRYGNIKIPAGPGQIIPVIKGSKQMAINTNSGLLYDSPQAAMEGYAPKLTATKKEKGKLTIEELKQKGQNYRKQLDVNIAKIQAKARGTGKVQVLEVPTPDGFATIPMIYVPDGEGGGKLQNLLDSTPGQIFTATYNSMAAGDHMKTGALIEAAAGVLGLEEGRKLLQQWANEYPEQFNKYKSAREKEEEGSPASGSKAPVEEDEG